MLLHNIHVRITVSASLLACVHPPSPAGKAHVAPPAAASATPRVNLDSQLEAAAAASPPVHEEEEKEEEGEELAATAEGEEVLDEEAEQTVEEAALSEEEGGAVEEPAPAQKGGCACCNTTQSETGRYIHTKVQHPRMKALQCAAHDV